MIGEKGIYDELQRVGIRCIGMEDNDKKDISVEYLNKYLTIKAERVESTQENEKVIRKERCLNCARSYYVGEVNESELKAKYENGILSVTVPKQQPKKPEKLGITIE